MLWGHKRLIGAISLILVLAAGLAYWSYEWTEKNPLDVTVIIKSRDPAVEFWQVLTDGVRVAAQEFDVNVQVWGPETEVDVDEQIVLVEKAIQNRPDVIVLASIEYDRLVPVAEKVKRNGIKLIIVDSGINSDAAQSIVATDNFKAGKEAGQEMLKQLTGPGKVAIVSYAKNSASQTDREKGIREVLEANPDIDLLDTYYVKGSEQNAYLMAKETLRKYSDVVGIVGLNEPTTVGAGRAIRELELKDRVKLIGFDSSFNEIKLLDEGVLKTTVIQRPFQMGYLSVKTAVEAARGKKIPDIIDTGSIVITKQNMYEEENQKLLFPFVGNEEAASEGR